MKRLVNLANQILMSKLYRMANQEHHGSEQPELLAGLIAPKDDAVIAPREAYHQKRGQMDDYLPGGKKWTNALATTTVEGEPNG